MMSWSVCNVLGLALGMAFEYCWGSLCRLTDLERVMFTLFVKMLYWSEL